LPETKAIALHFCCWRYGSVFITFYTIIFDSWTVWFWKCWHKNQVLHKI